MRHGRRADCKNYIGMPICKRKAAPPDIAAYDAGFIFAAFPVRRGLCHSDGTSAADRGHLYTVLHCAYTGERREIDDLFALVGKMPQAPEKEAAQWLLHESHRLSRIAAGLASGGRPEEAARYDALSRQIAAYAEKETFI